MANTKQDYIIEPDKIRETLQFWQHVRNQPMATIKCDNECLANLPRGVVSSEMYLLDEEPLSKKPKITHPEESTPVSPTLLNAVADNFCGGSSLLRSREEAENIVPLSATITVSLLVNFIQTSSFIWIHVRYLRTNHFYTTYEGTR